MKEHKGTSLAEYLERESNAAKKYVLRLYVTGLNNRSQRAIQNINTICRENLAGRYDLEVVDLLQKPALAKDDQIIAAPTLMKLLPLPLRRVVGDLSDRDGVLVGIDVKPKASGALANAGARNQK